MSLFISTKSFKFCNDNASYVDFILRSYVGRTVKLFSRDIINNFLHMSRSVKIMLDRRAICKVFLRAYVLLKIISLLCILILIVYSYRSRNTFVPLLVDKTISNSSDKIVTSVPTQVPLSGDIRQKVEQIKSLHEDFKRITLEDELRRRTECPLENFHSVQDWLQNQTHLPKLSDEKLFQFLYSCFYDVEKTKKSIEVFYQIKTSSPEFYSNRDISDPDLQKALTYTTTFTLPILTPEKCYRLTYLSIDTADTTNFDFNKVVKLFFMAYDAELYLSGTARGHVIIFDLKNCGFRHVMKSSLDVWKKIIKLTQEALPVRRKTLHVLNTNYFIYKFAQVLKPFINPEVFKTIHLHRPDDLEDFYKAIPKECLPSDYGGSLESIKILKKKFEQDAWKLRDFFNDDDKQVISSDRKT